MALTLSSNSFKEGETLRTEHILSADYGFGCSGGNKSRISPGRARRRGPRASP
jgi:hypothetical protein